MKTTLPLHKMRAGLLLLSMVFAVLASAFPGSAQAAVLPASTCTEVSSVRTCDLWATTGTLTLPGSVTVNIWGYAADSLSPAGLPGPMLIANAGETLKVNLHNNLGETTSLSIPGLLGKSDIAGVASGATKPYTYSGLQPGTYIYQAGPTANGERQVAMGMYGVLIVRPAGSPLQAYGPASAFNDEAVLVMSEIDPLLNASPSTYNMREYTPRYFLFNGKVYPNTDNIDTSAGNIVLLRLVNAGIKSRSLGVLGLRYLVVSMDGKAFSKPHFATAETLGAGQTADVLVNIPAAAIADQKYAVYDSSLRLINNSARFGGMLTFLHVVGTGGTLDTTGPTASGLSLTPNPSNGLTNPVVFNASVSDALTGGNNVVQAEYFIDSTGANDAGTDMTASTPPFDSPTEAVTASIDPSSISSGSHNVYIHGKDSLGNWGAFTSITLVLDKAGPTTTLSASPNPSNGITSVALNGSANDSASGNSNVTAAEYFIDVMGADGSGTTMTLNQTAPVVSLTATISATTMSSLSEGYHWVYVHSQDANGNWGTPAPLQIGVDKRGPATSAVQLRPNPNNGALPYSPSFQSVRLDATFTEPGGGPVTSTVANAEFFIDTPGTNGTGILITPSDGLFNSATENGYTYIPLLTVNTLSEGNHPIYVHGKDAVGNWGPFSTEPSAILVIDRTPPTAVSITRPGASPTNAATVQFTVNFSEAVTGLTNSNFTLVQSGGMSGASIASIANGSAAVTVTVNTGTGSGTLGLNLTSTTGAKDLAGNTLSSTGIPLTGAVYTVDKTAPTFTSVTINPTSIIQGTASITMAVNGSVDTGGSGLANAGEYWFDANAATSFTGTSGISVATSALSVGSHTLNVRIRDNVGNWSTVGTTTLAVVPPIPTLSILDNFNRANASNLGATWNQANTGTNVDLRVNSNQVVANQTNDGGQAIWNSTIFGSKQAAAFAFANTTLNNSAVILKATGASTTSPTNFIRVRYETVGGGRVRVYVTTNGGANYTTVGTLNSAFASGDTMTALVDSSGMVFVWKTSGATTTYLGSIQLPNNALWTTGTGRIGIQLQSTNARVDNFGGGTVP